jgi:hypothetical protein
VVPFPYHEALWELGRFDELPDSQRKPIMAFYRAALQRHLYVAGADRQLLSKNPSFTSFLRSLLETFPDGKVLCCVRDPVEVVPSQLSSVRAGAAFFGYDVGDPKIRDRFLTLLEFYAEHALSTLTDLRPDQYAWVPLGEMRQDVKAFVLSVYERFNWEPSAAFEQRLAEDAERGRGHKSRHSYSLEEFGLDEEEVRGRFRGLNARFGFDPAAGEKPAEVGA